MGLTVVTWIVYAAFLVLRWGGLAPGGARVSRAGRVLLVVLVRVVLTPFVHAMRLVLVGTRTSALPWS